MAIQFYNTDCIEFMRTKADNEYDLAIVDPPYGINFAKTHTGKGWTVRESKDWDKEIPPPEYWEQLFRISKSNRVGRQLYDGVFTAFNGLDILG